MGGINRLFLQWSDLVSRQQADRDKIYWNLTRRHPAELSDGTFSLQEAVECAEPLLSISCQRMSEGLVSSSHVSAFVKLLVADLSLMFEIIVGLTDFLFDVLAVYVFPGLPLIDMLVHQSVLFAVLLFSEVLASFEPVGSGEDIVVGFSDVDELPDSLSYIIRGSLVLPHKVVHFSFDRALSFSGESVDIFDDVIDLNFEIGVSGSDFGDSK